MDLSAGGTVAVAPLVSLLLLASGAPATGAPTPTSGSTSTTAPEAFAYWGSFLLEDGAWTFAPVGPSARPARDGTLEGWRFATVGVDARPRPPRGAPSFDEVCGDVEPADGQARVGVVVDYGRPVDAPPGTDGPPPEPRAACAQVPEGSSGEAVLDAVADLRAEDGVLCGLDGYPATTCQPAVDLSDAARGGEEPVDVAVGAPAPEVRAPGAAATGVAGALGLGAAVAAALVVSAGLAVGAQTLLRRRRGAR